MRARFLGFGSVMNVSQQGLALSFISKLIYATSVISSSHSSCLNLLNKQTFLRPLPSQLFAEVYIEVFNVLNKMVRVSANKIAALYERCLSNVLLCKQLVRNAGWICVRMTLLTWLCLVTRLPARMSLPRPSLHPNHTIRSTEKIARSALTASMTQQA